MDEDKIISQLLLIVEYELYDKITTTREGQFPKEKELIEEDIRKFESKLPERFKGLKNMHQLIMDEINILDARKEQSKREKEKNAGEER